MTLKERIQSDMKSAMKAGDKERLRVIRMLLAAIKQIEVDERRELDDAAVIAVLTRMVKQRRDSIAQFTEGGRKDLAAREETEIRVLEDYLPEPLSDEELDTVIDEAIAATGAAGIKDMGKVMGRVKDRVHGRADLGAVSSRVKGRLSA